jgi:hypothetical protein
VGLVLAFLAAPIGLVVSVIALVKSKVNGGKGLAIAGVIVSVLAMVSMTAIGVGVYFLAGAIGAPGQSVTALHEAVMDKDCAALRAETTESFREAQDLTTCAEVEQLAQGYSDYVFSIDSVEIVNSTATVETTESYVYNGRSRSEQNVYHLVRENGHWKVDSVE